MPRQGLIIERLEREVRELTNRRRCTRERVHSLDSPHIHQAWHTERSLKAPPASAGGTCTVRGGGEPKGVASEPGMRTLAPRPSARCLAAEAASHRCARLWRA
jgi:hypothetical protein